MEENIPTFVAITGSSADVARGFLEMAGGDFQSAVALFYENPDLVSGVGAATTQAQQGTFGTSRSNIGREDASGVIHIDSDDDDDDDMNLAQDSDDEDANAAVARAAALAQEEEDAAMAKRLQEELYSSAGGAGGGGEDDVRAPIKGTTETLVAPDPSWGADDDVGSHILSQIRRQRQAAAARSGGPFGQRIWSDSPSSQPSTAENGSHARRLEDLFRPPYDLMSRYSSWDEVRADGKEAMKWIMVNLQDMSDFNCQALNRDIWKDKAVKELVSENFIFIQYDKDYPDSEEYIQFYFPGQGHENPDNYPHVSIIDPRTGEQVKVWSGRPFPPATEFHAELAEFLDRYSLAANSKNPVAKATARKPQTVDVDRMTEEEMLEMALKNSMAGAAGETSESNPNIDDPDALTRSVDLGQADARDVAGSHVNDPFAQISSSNPHTEPENDPSTTTRIQFRHPNGRVIRRFKLQDPVRRIFEWLKAEPLEGKEGIRFELKQMPQGQDLIESLDKTIAESSLKQGTVMIEFIED